MSGRIFDPSVFLLRCIALDRGIWYNIMMDSPQENLTLKCDAFSIEKVFALNICYFLFEEKVPI